MLIALIQANVGNFDNHHDHARQESLGYDHFYFSDRNMALREQMSPRLQSKIPKMLGWELAPGYDYYIWLDANVSIKTSTAVSALVQEIGDKQIAIMKHPSRESITSETNYLLANSMEGNLSKICRNEPIVKQKDRYMRYFRSNNEVDDLLCCPNVFIYRNDPKVHEALKDWFYQCARYTVRDSLSFPFIVKKHRLQIKTISWDFFKVHFDYWSHAK